MPAAVCERWWREAAGGEIGGPVARERCKTGSLAMVEVFDGRRRGMKKNGTAVTSVSASRARTEQTSARTSVLDVRKGYKTQSNEIFNVFDIRIRALTKKRTSARSVLASRARDRRQHILREPGTDGASCTRSRLAEEPRDSCTRAQSRPCKRDPTNVKCRSRR